MSTEQPTISNASINSLPIPEIVDRSDPIPVVHVAVTQAVFNGIHRERTEQRRLGFGVTYREGY